LAVAGRLLGRNQLVDLPPSLRLTPGEFGQAVRAIGLGPLLPFRTPPGG
jgi:hypothetical protein